MGAMLISLLVSLPLMAITWTACFLYFLYAIVPIVLSILIYRRAKEYRMNTFLWVVMCLLFRFVGVNAFLAARRKRVKEICPKCFAKTPEGCEFCPECKVKLEEVRPEEKHSVKVLVKIGTVASVVAMLVFIAAHIALFIWLY
ncbi:MAG: hypothetical protein IJZ57_09900 [Clostridia bacterium]|nr:hypothetical protein [Clostridia bacterium]